MGFHKPIALISLAFRLANADIPSNSKLQFHIPKSLFRQGGYDHREALFGIPPYGGTITQNVYYPGKEMGEACGEVDMSAGFPIRPVDDETGRMDPFPRPFILMVDRGECTFVQKVRNAQRSGAAAVLIADNSCLCDAPNCVSEYQDECEPREPLMADDGSGSDITIPAFLMFKQDSDLLRQELESNHMVQAEMSWSLPSPDNRVEYELWTTPTDQVSRDFQKSFKAAAIALGQGAYFTPRMYIYDGEKSNCQSDSGENECYTLCTNSGLYCATDPDNDLDRGISGADVVAESLRRMCIWSIYGADDGVGVQWWDYVNEFMFRCDTPEYFANENCISDVYIHAEVDKALVEKCIKESGGLSGNVRNSLLEDALMAKEQQGVVILPQAYVNNAAIRGALEFDTMFRAICAGYVKGSEPDICKICLPCSDELGCVEQGSCPSGSNANDVSTPVFAASLLGLSAFFLCVGMIQYRKTQNRLREQVRGIVAEYMPLDEDKAIDTEIS